LKLFVRLILVALLSILGLISLTLPQKTAAAGSASLFFSPANGNFQVDSTFEVSVMLNSGGSSVNAIEAFISFPADKLQVVNPTVSKSFISIWIAAPSYSNTEGKISFQGGIPTPGITTSAGVISTIQFRVKATGAATLKFNDNSRVLANDGGGTNILSSRSQASLNLQLAPPSGPVISSPTHPDQNKWYRETNISFTWEPVANATSYGYAFDNSPNTTPSETTTTAETQLSQTANGDGIWYFHLRAKNSNSWGGSSHFPVRIDATVPASFKPTLDKKTFSLKESILVSFVTTDATSGIDHYEVKVISNGQADSTGFFVEQDSPYQLPPTTQGDYKVAVRAFDRANNYTDALAEFSVGQGAANPYLERLASPGLVLILLGLLVLFALILIIVLATRRRQVSVARLEKDLERVGLNVEQKQKELQQLLAAQTLSRERIDRLSQPLPKVETISRESFDARQISTGQELQQRSPASGNETESVS